MHHRFLKIKPSRQGVLALGTKQDFSVDISEHSWCTVPSCGMALGTEGYAVCCPAWVFTTGFEKTKTHPDASKCTFLKNPAVPM